MVYISEPFLPLDVDVPSLRVTLHDFMMDEDYRVIRLEQLEFLEEHQHRTHEHLKVYENRLSRYYNKKVKSHVFSNWRLVLQENTKNKTNQEIKVKLEAN